MKTTVKKSPKAKHTVQSFVEKDLPAKLAKAKVTERITLAEKLESQAAELRNFKPKPIELEARITFYVRPEMKRALLKFGEAFGAARHKDEGSKLADASRWYLEMTLPMFRKVTDQTNAFATYRDTEDLEDSVFTEKLIADELARYDEREAERKAANADEDED